MKQLSIFAAQDLEEPKREKVVWQLYVDGAARGNPGPAGAGIYIKKEEKAFIKQGFYLGKKTNNQAEYLALILGLCQLLSEAHPQDEIQIFSDSELLIRQIMGIYKVKDATLQRLYKRLMAMLESRLYVVKHVMREKNSIADALANEGVDKKIHVPLALQHYCNLAA